MSLARGAVVAVALAVVVLGGPPLAAASPVPLPGIQTSAPGAVQTPSAVPAAPGEPFPWAFVVFGVLGVALLIAWAVLGRRERGSGAEETDDDGDRA
ncbi:hypothetical protein [Sinomonas sp. P47F7]|uniref:hypothetical protein n=1 Tax=Sinomonas sp. P47F7 TaxID=3410987 RepID=UPI003BF59203